MSSPSPFPQMPAHRIDNQRWLVTFGDLLTLLLCFFLASIGLGPLGSGGSKQQNQAVKTGIQQNDSLTESGTKLAETSLVETTVKTTTQRSLALSAASIDDAVALRRIIGIWNSEVAERGNSVAITSCSTAVNETLSEASSTIMKLSKELLMNTNLEVQRFVNLGSDCERLQDTSNYVSARILARIDIVESHG